jgi:lipopolysaccharide/colanic/teichoic acid biosynthesis glycosyltransferase
MLNKIFKSFHAAIENDVAASLGDFAVNPPDVLDDSMWRALSDLSRRTIKRTVDVCFSFLMLFISLPLFLVLALAIKVTSRGPVFFRQERVGLEGRRFKIYKFRTMITHASEAEHKAVVEALLKDGSTESLAKYAEYIGRQVTPMGRFLRASSLDELPQLINIFLGQMSLVGPRPHPVYEVDAYKKWYRRRLQVKPGLTGWSKLKLRYTPDDYEEAILYDLWYVDHWNLTLDFRILLMTVPFVLSMKDAT